MSVFDQEDDQNKDYLAELTGPGGKFDRTKYGSETDMYKAIAQGKVFADRTLEHKNREFDELREAYLAKSAEADAAAKFDELVTRFENRDNRDTTNTQKVGDVEQPQLDQKKIEDLVSAKLVEIEAKRNEKANLDKVDSRLRERYGDNARNILRDKMNTLGITDEDLKFLAKRSPEAVFNALGLNQQQTEDYQSVPRSNTRSDSFKPQVTVRDAVYYEKLRTDQPKEYFKQETSVQRLKDMDSPDFLKRYNEQRRT